MSALGNLTDSDVNHRNHYDFAMKRCAMEGSHDSKASGPSHHMMNSYFSTHYKGYPVVIRSLYADNGAQVFGIFLLIILLAFVYKAVLFISWCLEVKWFKAVDQSTEKNPKNQDDENAQQKINAKIPNLLEIFTPTIKDSRNDFIRLILSFISTALIYVMMLISMTYVVVYFFAVVLGLSMAEVFFNRIKIVFLRRWDLKRELERRRNCSGGGDCLCDSHIENIDTFALNQKTDKASSVEQCCCTTVLDGREEELERQVNELTKQREQVGSMDVDLMPAERFK